MTDRYSYRQDQGLLLWLTEFYSDLYMKRAYKSLKFLTKPDAVLFLGDLLDGGREWHDDEFDEEVKRFHWVFPQSRSMPSYYMAGNHDVGFGSTVIWKATSRFKKYFGQMSYNLTAAGHQIVVLDTVSLSAMSDQRDDAMIFMQNISEKQYPGPRILFTHVPLYRPNGASCGNTGRVAKPISQGSGYQYQNLVDKSLSQLILESIRPEFVFSGDDHDQCLYVHSLLDGTSVPEYTVGTFSWLQGNPYPSFGQLHLKRHQKQESPALSQEFSVCFLPSQFHIYFSYIGIAIVCLLYGIVVIFRIPIPFLRQVELVRYHKPDNWHRALLQCRNNCFIFLKSFISILFYGVLYYAFILMMEFL